MSETKRTYDKKPPDARNLTPGGVGGYGRQSSGKEKQSKSLADQKTCVTEQAEEYNLPFDPATDWYEEPKGHGGDLYWVGGGDNGLSTTKSRRRYRHTLTRLLNDIESGKIRCCIVYSLDRLWRSISICEALLDFFYDHDCLVFDRSGMVNLWNLEGRNSIMQNAVMAQYQREYSAVHAPRGVKKSRDAGKMVVPGRVPGFLAKGGKSGKVDHLEEEQELVNWLFRGFDVGFGAGPLTTGQLADLMESDGKRLYDETGGQSPHGKRRLKINERTVYEGRILRILRDCRYIGKQRFKDVEYPCTAFLKPDGSTVVDRELYARVQDKLQANKRVSYRSRNQRPLASLVRCGVDGEALTAQKQHKNDDVGHWIKRRKAHGCTCDHAFPNVREDVMDAYIADIIAPILLEEIHGHQVQSDWNDADRKRLTLLRRLKEEDDYRNIELIDQSNPSNKDRVSPNLLGKLEQASFQRTAQLRVELEALDADQPRMQAAAPTLGNLRDAPKPAVRDALRLCLRWVAIFATPSEREPRPGFPPSYSYAPSIVGKLVFLLASGQYHTGVIYRERFKDRGGYFPFRMRPAQPEEAIGGVADFPDPQKFITGLTRAYHGQVYPFAPHEIAPGYKRVFDQSMTPLNDEGDQADDCAA